MTEDTADGEPRRDRSVASLEERLRRLTDGQGRQRRLLDAVVAISADMDTRTVLRHIVTAGTHLIDARHGALGVLGEDGAVVDLITVGAPECDTSGAPAGHPSTRAVLGVPLTVRGTVYGNLCLTGKNDGTPFTDDDEALLTALASAASVSIENARLYERLKYTTEQFQRRMLPDLPDLGPIEVRARYQPASELPRLGGDWYDVLVLPDGVPCVVVGDVTGHDPGVAPVMGQFRYMLHALAHDRGGPPGTVVSKLDDVVGTLDDPPAATLVFGRLEERHPGRYTFHWTNAGHPPPLLIPQEGAVRFLAPPRHGIPVGVDPRLPRPDHEHPLPPGSTLVLFTDGLVERRDQDIDESLRALAAHAGSLATVTPDALCDELLAHHGQVFDDDVAILVVRVPPLPGSRPGPQPRSQSWSPS
ncbi:PP2C family protein-serine/threonine phosphatase [Actinacidiphila paucisporea]|uniref:Serine phosphatase RsbU, regulator of sigma subunit n=1 Tax=Actinacidiphila paucisporea TaxID=310782 RepID=A0A1M7G470_9ACTN|nr:GAF domain-containing SpoIIE family protein phosphatase [Actinacidiphila paucisporea]SHM10639.1 Serine phosphatase RsbU, regulator of sigma subunit [Actinacidiphila paucisporea]